jgi:hypothetical protein
LFFRLSSKKTLNFKGDSCNCGKSCKERITIPACNADETDVLPLFSGKSGKHLCSNYARKFCIEAVIRRKFKEGVLLLNCKRVFCIIIANVQQQDLHGTSRSQARTSGKTKTYSLSESSHSKQATS